ncbi:hypothetical protein [Limibacterium fermenti]|mgnify:CR=1 FL=1|jgi:hypothetical protein|uniref:hypothetical protein n=1 Tax=Limibacterium fermenti TaxID=3229863 RepID=UPI000E829BE9|nr:hypothetical protein [Porphyromonadaceae bacterium]HBK31130.1 hypothetical protein [Porphyromonadaceae bacterium]HBX20508.1 hypothetical protein [Porphyromonadaceae bacterium]HBX45949.1 hypothetical protein [Porphyromonadaceae bacterium]
MGTKHTILFAFIFLSYFLTAYSCAEEVSEHELDLQSPYETEWKFEKDIEGDNLSNNRRSTNEEEPFVPFLLKFNRDNTFTGTSSNNRFQGQYTINTTRSILSIIDIEKQNPHLMETKEGFRYMANLKNVKYYSVSYANSIKVLRLYYSDNKENYLQYKERK